MTTEDRMLALILRDSDMSEYYEYSPEQFTTIQEAMKSENLIVNVVARIVRNVKEDDRSKHQELYTIIFNELKKNLL